MKTVLITGGAGFIGSGFTRYIFERYPEYKILVVDALTYAGTLESLPVAIGPELKNERFEFWYGDINNGELMDSLVSRSDFVVHLAAESHITRSIYDNTIFVRTNVLGTQILANAVCKYQDRIERFIHVSTSEVYGTALSEDMTEEHPLNPMSPYAGSKVGADRLIYSYGISHGLPIVIVRPFNNFGPRQHLEKVIPRFVTNILLNETPTVHGSGRSIRDFVHIHDTCRALDLVLHASPEKVIGQVFNIGTGTPRTVLSILEDISEIMSFDKDRCFHIDDRPGQVLRHRANIHKIKTVLGWEPEVRWKDGLEPTIQWYRDHENWWRRMLWMRYIPMVTRSGKEERY